MTTCRSPDLVLPQLLLSIQDNDFLEVGDYSAKPITRSLSNTGQRGASDSITGLVARGFSYCPNGCPNSQTWLHDDVSSVSPVETIIVIVEELLQGNIRETIFTLIDAALTQELVGVTLNDSSAA